MPSPSLADGSIKKAILVLGHQILDDEDASKMSFIIGAVSFTILIITSIQRITDFHAEYKFSGWLDEKAILVLGHQILGDEDASKMSFEPWMDIIISLRNCIHIYN